MLIAPKATVTINNTSSGWIVADTVTNPGGEWHFVYQNLLSPLEVTVEAENGWMMPRRTENFEGQILFRETFHTPGTYYYRVSEVPEGGAYQ